MDFHCQLNIPFGGHAPYELKNTTWEQERDGFTCNVFNALHRITQITVHR